MHVYHERYLSQVRVGQLYRDFEVFARMMESTIHDGGLEVKSEVQAAAFRKRSTNSTPWASPATT